MSAISATDSYNHGLTCYAQGDLDAAITQYSQAIAIKPDYAAAFHNRGLARYDQDDLDAAIADYDQAIALYSDGPDEAIAYYNRGNARYDQDDLDAAIVDYDQAIDLNPDDATAYIDRGIARQKQGHLDAAIADFDQAIALKPDDAAAFYNRGIARYDQGDLDAAIADYDQAIALNPDYEDTLLDGGRVRSDQEVLEAIVADYLTAFDTVDLSNVSPANGRGETDLKLLRRLQAGDNLAWDQLVAEWQGPLYQHLYYSLPTPDNAADVLQETLEALVGAFQHFDGKVALSTFIYVIASRKVADFFLRRTLLRDDSNTLGNEHPKSSRESNVAQDVLDWLQPQYREVLLLYYRMGINTAELARYLDKSRQAIQSLLNRSRRQFVFALKDASPRS